MKGGLAPAQASGPRAPGPSAPSRRPQRHHNALASLTALARVSSPRGPSVVSSVPPEDLIRSFSEWKCTLFYYAFNLSAFITSGYFYFRETCTLAISRKYTNIGAVGLNRNSKDSFNTSLLCFVTRSNAV